MTVRLVVGRHGRALRTRIWWRSRQRCK